MLKRLTTVNENVLPCMNSQAQHSLRILFSNYISVINLKNPGVQYNSLVLNNAIEYKITVSLLLWRVICKYSHWKLTKFGKFTVIRTPANTCWITRRVLCNNSGLTLYEGFWIIKNWNRLRMSDIIEVNMSQVPHKTNHSKNRLTRLFYTVGVLFPNKKSFVNAKNSWTWSMKWTC
jgi:hypothetical protein